MTSPEKIESLIDIEREKEDNAARLIWEYMQMHHEPQKSDVILVLGGGDIRIAECAVELYKKGFAPAILFSGSGSIHNDKPGRDPIFQGTTEAEVFADIARKQGVPDDAILIENKSQNTGQNYEFSIETLKKAQVSSEKMIVVGKKYTERRVYATAKKWLPESDVRVVSPELSLETYMGEDRKKCLSRLVGHLQRIREYVNRGFQIPQDIPDDVWKAGEYLYERGYNARSIAD